MNADLFALKDHIIVERDEPTGEVILVDGQTGAMCASNQAAAALLLSLEAGATLQTLAYDLTQAFEVTELVARRDSLAFLNALGAQGFVETLKHAAA